MEYRTEDGVPLLRLLCTIVTQHKIGIYNNATINRKMVIRNLKGKRKRRKVHSVWCMTKINCSAIDNAFKSC